MKKALLFLLPGLAIAFIIATLIADLIVRNAARGSLYDKIEEVPPYKTGVVLGTVKSLKNGQPNLYFHNRIAAAVELYKNGKIRYIIVSGDNHRKGYNEPLDMRDELIRLGVPESAILLDYAGFRTLDSIIRAKEIFGQDGFIIISQQFHNERAFYIARKNGIRAIGYNAQDVSRRSGLKTRLREYLARDKLFFDLLFGVRPKYGGSPIDIENFPE